jgi:hypothetical protein
MRVPQEVNCMSMKRGRLPCGAALEQRSSLYIFTYTREGLHSSRQRETCARSCLRTSSQRCSRAAKDGICNIHSLVATLAAAFQGADARDEQSDEQRDEQKSPPTRTHAASTMYKHTLVPRNFCPPPGYYSVTSEQGKERRGEKRP